MKRNDVCRPTVGARQGKQLARASQGQQDLLESKLVLDQVGLLCGDMMLLSPEEPLQLRYLRLRMEGEGDEQLKESKGKNSEKKERE